MANRPQLDEICSTTFSTAYAHLFTCHAFTNTVNYLHVVRKQEDCTRLDCNRDAVRFNHCQLERIHARARVDMSMLATGKMAFRVESGLIVRPSLSLDTPRCGVRRYLHFFWRSIPTFSAEVRSMSIHLVRFVNKRFQKRTVLASRSKF